MNFPTPRARRMACSAIVALTLAAASAAQAQNAPAPEAPAQSQQQQVETEKSAAGEAAQKARIAGPTQIKLRDQGVLDLPDGFTFLPQPEAGRLMRAYGNYDSKELIGIVEPQSNDARWWATLDFLAAGYVKDDDAKNWNADELLTNLKEGTKSNNEDRAKRGFPAMEVTGWIEPPAYDSAAHRLVWSALVREIGASGDEGSVNYNTYALGREGYFSLDLITNKAAIETDKSAARQMLGRISYSKGKAYEDFDASSDHVAEYGLAALVGGVALKKLGLLALGAAFVLKFAKIIAIAAIALVAGVRQFFVRAKKNAPPNS